MVVKAQIHAGGRGKAGGVKLARSAEDCENIAKSLLGATLRTHQTGPEGRVVRRLLIEQGVDLAGAREMYLAIVIDRASGAPVFMASVGRRHGHRGGRGHQPQGDPEGSGRSRGRLPALPGPEARLWPRPPGGGGAARGVVHADAVPRVRGHRRLAPRDQPVPAHAGRERPRPGRQDQLRRQRALPPSRPPGAARLRRGGPAGGGGVEVRPQLHQARRRQRRAAW